MNVLASPRTVAPAGVDEVVALVRACAAGGAAIVVAGGETLQSIGNAPARCDVVLRTAGMTGFHEYDPRDLTAGIAAGTTHAAVARALAEAGQWLPLDVPHPARATIGGTLAAGWAGPRRTTYGRARDLLIGSTAVLANGTVARAGGMVVKNVTGYDMSKLYVGSLGTLGIVVRANFKTLVRPATQRLAIAPVSDDVRDRAAGALGALSIEPSAALMIDGFHRLTPRTNAPLRLAVLFEGSAARVDRGTRDMRSALGRAGVAETMLIDGDEAERVFAAIVDGYVATVDDRSLTYRATGLPSSAWSRSRALLPLAQASDLTFESIADLRTGDVIARFTARDASSFAARLDAFDAAVRAAADRSTLLAGAPALRERIDAWGAPPSTIATMRALKERFDPLRILAPGRFVGGI